jgi:hypothetical protein
MGGRRECLGDGTFHVHRLLWGFESNLNCRASIPVGRLNGSLLGCLRKDFAPVSHCVLSLEWGDDGECLGDGTFHVHRVLQDVSFYGLEPRKRWSINVYRNWTS